MTLTEEIGKSSNLSRRTTIEILKFVRNICGTKLEMDPVTLGGPGMVVHMDTNCLGHNPDRNSDIEP